MKHLTTKIFIIVIAVVAVVYASILALNNVAGDEISAVMAEWGWRWQSVPYAAGVLMGHFFVPRRKVTEKWFRLNLLILTTMLFLVCDIVFTWEVYPLIPLGVGVLVGGVLWPMAHK